MNNQEFKNAFDYLVKEKGLDPELIKEAMTNAFTAAYKKNTGEDADIRCEINTDNGMIRVFKRMTVVDGELENPDAEYTLEEAQEEHEGAQVGGVYETEVETEDFGRVAISVAKQVVLQKIREAERKQVMDEFRDKTDELMIGFLAMEDSRNYYVDLGKARGILPKNELIPGEKLNMGDSVKVYVTKVEETSKGPSIRLSRKHYGFVKRLFESEIPEFKDGLLLMHGVAREAGVRSKVAVSSTSANVDAIGSCIGEKGRRIASIIKALNGEKIDLVLYSEDPEVYIANALSPAKNLNVSIMDEKKKEALAITDKENLSLAIGKQGINIKLASKLTKYNIQVKTLDDINKQINE